ncbi:MAG: hypothetical protein ACR2GG_08910 [Gemmatimonadaceae bacterium]
MSATVDRDEVLAFAAEHGAQAAAERFGVPAGTVRSWRARAERKVEDRRAREPEPGPERDLWWERPEFANTFAEHRGDGLVDVMVPSYSAGPDPSTGGDRKVPARARLVPRFVLGAELMSSAPVRDLGVPPDAAATLKAGDLVLLGKAEWANFADAVWEVVAQAGGWREKYPYRPTLPRRFDENTGASGAPTADDPDPYAGWRLLRMRPARDPQDAVQARAVNAFR